MVKRKDGGNPQEVTGGGLKYAIHNLDLSTVELSTSPLDDYQRLFFARLLSRPNVDQRRNLDVKRVTYKSSIAEAFANPACVVPDAGLSHDGASPRMQLSQRRPSGSAKYVLDCFEYQLPDVLLGVQSGLEQFASLSKGSKARLGLDEHPGRVLSGTISMPGDPAQSEGFVAPTQGEGDELVANPLTKNQQFKLRKIDHSLQQNSKLINPNNCVLWTHESGYVFLTGIWRLYQDVMRGLISLPRVDDSNRAEVQEVCKRELDYIITTAFYESGACPPTGCSDRRKRRQSAGSDMPSSTGQGSLSSPTIQTSANPSASVTHYTDLHWNSLSPDLKQMMCDTYRNHLIHEKGFSPQDLVKCDFAEVIKRVRGGYIKIQGTWLPLETARLLCVRFCYPIRYLLVPIFGPNFPTDCENWFKYIQNQLKIREANKSKLSPSPVDVGTQPRRRKRRDSTKSKVSKPVGNELLNAFQNLLDISKNPPLANPTPKQISRRSSSCAPECALMQRRSSLEKLPPISAIMQSISPRSSVGHHSDSGYTSLTNIHRDSGIESQPQIHPNPTVQTLSHLASFYNTNGHRYSYPGNVYMSHQKPVSNRMQSTPNDGLFEMYMNKPSSAPMQEVSVKSEMTNATNYKPVNFTDGSDKWFPRSRPQTSGSGNISNPASPGQKNNVATLTTSYPEMNAPMTYWFSATR